MYQFLRETLYIFLCKTLYKYLSGIPIQNFVWKITIVSWAPLGVARGTFGPTAGVIRSSVQWVGATELRPRGKFRRIFTAKFTAYCS